MRKLFQTLEAGRVAFSKPWKGWGTVFPSLGKTHRSLFQALEKTGVSVSNAWKLALVLLLAVTIFPAAAQFAPTRAAVEAGSAIKEIRIERRGGGGTIDNEAVLAFVGSKVGEELSRNALARDVKNLDKSGRFSYVESRVDKAPGGYILTFVVEPKLRIRKLRIVGADDLGNRKVQDLLELSPGDIADDATIAAHTVKVVDKYNKKYYPEPKLTWAIAPVAGTDVADVTITVKEGPYATVKDINFVGNEHLSARKLRAAMKQQREWLFTFITGDGTYDPDAIATDREALRKAYMDEGYLDVEVGDLAVHPVGKSGLAVDVQITEGVVYHISSVAVNGATKFTPQELLKNLKLKSGELAAMDRLDKMAQALHDYYGSRGYIRTIVDVHLDTAAERRTAAVTFNIREGQLSYIRNIRIRGNTRTKDKVIRRELTVSPGELYNEVRVRNSESRLRNMGYFKFVAISPSSTVTTNEYDLAIDVEEDRTGTFMIGAGFSSIDSLVGFAEMSQGNFNLFGPGWVGGGQKLKLRVQGGTQRRDVELSFIEPYFLDHRLSFGVDLYEHDSFYYSTEYNQKDTGGRLTLGQPLGQWLGGFDRLNYIYSLDAFNIYDVSTNASPLIQQEAGARLKSAFTLELVHDARNKPFVPTSGNRTSISGQIAGGPLGGDTDIYGFQLRSSQFVPLWFDHVLSLRGQMGFVDAYNGATRVPLFDRMFLGGPYTMRGFKFREVGPTDGYPNNEPIGGDSMLFGSAEYTIPIIEKIRIASFVDIGMVWPDPFYLTLSGLNSDFGFGIRFDFPGFPIQLDYAWPIHSEEFNNHPSGRFSFSIGYQY